MKFSEKTGEISRAGARGKYLPRAAPTNASRPIRLLPFAHSSSQRHTARKRERKKEKEKFLFYAMRIVTYTYESLLLIVTVSPRIASTKRCENTMIATDENQKSP